MPAPRKELLVNPRNVPDIRKLLVQLALATGLSASAALGVVQKTNADRPAISRSTQAAPRTLGAISHENHEPQVLTPEQMGTEVNVAGTLGPDEIALDVTGSTPISVYMLDDALREHVCGDGEVNVATPRAVEYDADPHSHFNIFRVRITLSAADSQCANPGDTVVLRFVDATGATWQAFLTLPDPLEGDFATNLIASPVIIDDANSSIFFPIIKAP